MRMNYTITQNFTGYRRGNRQVQLQTHFDSVANSTAKSIAKYVVTPSKKPTGKEKKKKTAGVYTPHCDHMTILTWIVIESTFPMN
jgi:hypothetical protein